MSRPSQPHTPESRGRAQTRLGIVTRVAVLAATGITVVIGVVAAHEHPGSSSTRNAGGSTSSGTGGSGSSSISKGSSSSSGVGNSSTPSTGSSTPSVTSGGSSP
jgi:hypothetical protein